MTYKVWDRVRVTNSGCTYTWHRVMAKKLGIEASWKQYWEQPIDWEDYEIIAKHSNTHYAIKDPISGSWSFIMSPKWFELANPPMSTVPVTAPAYSTPEPYINVTTSPDPDLVAWYKLLSEWFKDLSEMFLKYKEDSIQLINALQGQVSSQIEAIKWLTDAWEELATIVSQHEDKLDDHESNLTTFESNQLDHDDDIESLNKDQALLSLNHDRLAETVAELEIRSRATPTTL